MPRKKTPRLLCVRCGERPPLPGPRRQVCSECYGKCRDCGKPTPLDTEGYPKARCTACLIRATRKCNKCGASCRGSKYPYECLECGRRYQRERYHYRKAHGRPKPRENSPLKRQKKRLGNYGLTLEGYELLLAAQDGVCALCRGTPKTFHVDHCHSSGKVRGLLCNNCNAALGFGKDDPTVLRRMADYLEHHQQEK